MPWSDWNPLSYFKELRLFPRTVFFIGFVFFWIGVGRGVSCHNGVLILSFAIISFSLACQYFFGSIRQEWGPPYRKFVVWGRALAATTLLVVAAGFLLWAYCLTTHCHFPISG